MSDKKSKITTLNAETKTFGKAKDMGETPVSLLQEAIREVRVASAERAESAADIAELNRLKLEMLVESLKDTFEESERYQDLFDCAISNVPTPRLFIDAISHIAMARDQKTYRFVRSTRQGRVILEESVEISVVSNAVTRYMAERIVEHQTLLDQPLKSEDVTPKTSLTNKEPELTSAREPEGPWSDFFLGLLWFFIGVIVGAGLLYLWANDMLNSSIITQVITTFTQ